jgi:hypothetical protein
MYKFAYGEAKKGTNTYSSSQELWFMLGLASNKLNRPNTAEYLNKAIALGLHGEKLLMSQEILSNL